MASTFADVSIPPPPKFDARKCESFSKELLFWRDTHGGIAEHVPIAQLAAQCPEDTLAASIGSYMEPTRDRRQGRNFRSLMKSLDRELARTGQEIAADKMRSRRRIERRTHETLRDFGIRFGRMGNSSFRIGITAPDLFALQ